MQRAKTIFVSKSFLVAVIAFVAFLVQGRYGWIIDADLQGMILGLVMVGLRLVTDRPVKFLPEKKPSAGPPSEERPSGPPGPASAG